MSFHHTSVYASFYWKAWNFFPGPGTRSQCCPTSPFTQWPGCCFTFTTQPIRPSLTSWVTSTSPYSGWDIHERKCSLRLFNIKHEISLTAGGEWIVRSKQLQHTVKNNQRCDDATVITLITFLNRHVPKCFIHFIPQHSAEQLFMN